MMARPKSKAPAKIRDMKFAKRLEQGWNTAWIEKQLAHTDDNEIRAAYNTAEYLPERRRMMQHWADYLEGLKAG